MTTDTTHPKTNHHAPTSKEKNLEIEIKLHVQEKDIPNLRQKILDLGFTLWDKDSFENNIVFDTKNQELKNKHMLLRLRQKNSLNIITLKRPVEATLDSLQFKIREEIEMAVSDFDTAQTIITALGYEIFFIYEKYREVFAKDTGNGIIKIMVDRTPMGYFLEIEGTCQHINEVAGQLGFTTADYITANYLTLFREHHPTGFMLFS